jgi:UPF0716 protein FxsA
MRTTRRRLLPWLLVVVFVLVPLAEIYVLVQVGQVIGAWWTILLLLADGLLGAWLVKREGRRAWQALRAALESHRMPARELADGALVVMGGALLLAPGFVTDVFGILLVLPLTRPLFRGLLASWTASRVTTTVIGRQGRQEGRPGPGAPGDVVRGEVVDD